MTGERLALSVASQGVGGGCTGADVGNTGLGGTARWGVEAIVGVGVNGGGGVGGVSTSKNRPPHHKYKYKSPKQFELKGSRST